MSSFGTTWKAVVLKENDTCRDLSGRELDQSLVLGVRGVFLSAPLALLP